MKFAMLCFMVIFGAQSFADDSVQVTSKINMNPIVFEGFVFVNYVHYDSFTMQYNTISFGPEINSLNYYMSIQFDADGLDMDLNVYNSAMSRVGKIYVAEGVREQIRLAAAKKCPFKAIIQRDMSSAVIDFDCDLLR